MPLSSSIGYVNSDVFLVDDRYSCFVHPACKQSNNPYHAIVAPKDNRKPQIDNPAGYLRVEKIVDMRVSANYYYNGKNNVDKQKKLVSALSYICHG